METTGDNLIQVKKERSYISCLVNGWSYGFKHLGLLLRYIWPGLILTSLLPFPFVFLYEGQVGAILRKLTELGYLPNVTINTLRDDVVRCSLRSMVTFLMVFLLLIVWGVPMFLPLFIGVSFWWGFLVSLVLFVAFLPPLFLISMHLLLSDYSIGKSISEGLRMGYKNFGKLFAFELLNILIIIPVYLIASIPFHLFESLCLPQYYTLPTLQYFLAVKLTGIEHPD